MVYLKYRVRPKPHTDYFVKYGGAYVGCWIRTNSQKIAQARASRKLSEEGWIIEALEEMAIVRGIQAAKSAPFITQAKAEGQAYAVFSWPARPQKKDKIH